MRPWTDRAAEERGFYLKPDGSLVIEDNDGMGARRLSQDDKAALSRWLVEGRGKAPSRVPPGPATGVVATGWAILCDNGMLTAVCGAGIEMDDAFCEASLARGARAFRCEVREVEKR